MVNVITVEREYGSEGGVFARHLAERLGWKLVDECLIEEVATLAGVTPELAAGCDERLDPWYHRIGKAFWHGSNERSPGALDNAIFDSDQMTVYLQQALIKEAASGNCVIVGRGAPSVLNTVPGCFHIFVYASMPRKVKWFIGQFPAKAKQAEQEILATDRRRADYIRRVHQHDWANPHLYHLLLNSCMGHDAMVGATLEATGIHHDVTA